MKVMPENIAMVSSLLVRTHFHAQCLYPHVDVMSTFRSSKFDVYVKGYIPTKNIASIESYTAAFQLHHEEKVFVRRNSHAYNSNIIFKGLNFLHLPK